MNIYFKFSLRKFLRKFPLLKHSPLTPSYFKTSFKAIKKVCRANVNIFTEEKRKKLVSLFFIYFFLVWIGLENFIH